MSKEVGDIEKVNSIPMVDDDPFADEKPKEGTPEELAQREELRNMLKGNDMVMRTLINDDFTAATVLVRMKNNGKGLEITPKSEWRL